jgi:hypothetical protein
MAFANSKLSGSASMIAEEDDTMKHEIARPDLRASSICLACVLRLSVLSVTADAQVELRADKQILFEATDGAQTIKKGAWEQTVHPDSIGEAPQLAMDIGLLRLVHAYDSERWIGPHRPAFPKGPCR